jgi:hypothetical protein
MGQRCWIDFTKTTFAVGILSLSFWTLARPDAVNAQFKAGCNVYGCSQSSGVECTAYGCPKPGGKECGPYGCPNPGAGECTAFGCPDASSSPNPDGHSTETYNRNRPDSSNSSDSNNSSDDPRYPKPFNIFGSDSPENP